jgi:hypothetical protein
MDAPAPLSIARVREDDLAGLLPLMAGHHDPRAQAVYDRPGATASSRQVYELEVER